MQFTINVAASGAPYYEDGVDGHKVHYLTPAGVFKDTVEVNSRYAKLVPPVARCTKLRMLSRGLVPFPNGVNFDFYLIKNGKRINESYCTIWTHYTTKVTTENAYSKDFDVSFEAGDTWGIQILSFERVKSFYISGVTLWKY